MDVFDTALEVIDLRSFSNLWYWIALAAFAGLNLIQASFTGFCPAAMLFKRLGVRQGVAFK